MTATWFDINVNEIVDSAALNRVVAVRPDGDDAAAVKEWDEFWNPPSEAAWAAVLENSDADVQVTRSCAAPLRLAPQTAIPKIDFRKLRQKRLFDETGWPPVTLQKDFFGFDVAALRNPATRVLTEYGGEEAAAHIFIPFNSKLKTRHGNSFRAFNDLGIYASVKVPNLHTVMKDINDLAVQSASVASTLGVFSHTLVPWAVFSSAQGQQTIGKTERGRLRSRYPRQLKAIEEAWRQTAAIPVTRHHCDAVVRCIVKLCPARLAGIKIWGALSPSSLPIPFLRAGKTNSPTHSRPFGAVPDLLLYDSTNAKVFAIEIKTQYSDELRPVRFLREQLRQCALQALAVSFSISKSIAVVPVLVKSRIGVDISAGQTIEMYKGEPIPAWRSQEAKNILADALRFSGCNVSDDAGRAYKGSTDAMARKLRQGLPLAAKVQYINLAME